MSTNKRQMSHQTRRQFISRLGTLSLTGLAPAYVFPESNSQSNGFSSLTPLETLKAYVRLLGSLKSATIYTWFSGELWSILPNSAPAPLVSFQGLAKSVWESPGNDVYIQHSFDTGFFGDLRTGEKISVFENPMTGETVRPYPFLYGGGTRKYSIEGIDSGGSVKPIEPKWVQSGDQVWIDELGSGSFDNPIDPVNWPKESAGQRVHFGSTTSYIAKASEVLDPDNDYANYTLSWSSITPWEPWLLMGNTPGFVQWRATGRKLSHFSQAPEDILEHARQSQPNFLDSGRPWKGNKSTWRSFMSERRPAS